MPAHLQLHAAARPGSRRFHLSGAVGFAVVFATALLGGSPSLSAADSKAARALARITPPPFTEVFHDPFQHQLGPGWSWVREDRSAWRVTADALEIRIQPGNMWGGANNARNLLVRPAPDPAQQAVAAEVRIENRPTEQYEQVDLVWYYSDKAMVKIGQELVDGKLSLVMGREEADRTRTIAIIPLEGDRLEVRLVAEGTQIRGEFRTPPDQVWQRAGSCELPIDGAPKLSLMAYQGPAATERWVKLSSFRVATRAPAKPTAAGSKQP